MFCTLDGCFKLSFYEMEGLSWRKPEKRLGAVTLAWIITVYGFANGLPPTGAAISQ